MPKKDKDSAPKEKELTVASIREMESAIRDDKKQANLILDIRRALSRTDLPVAVRLAAMHTLRRLLIAILESGLLLSSSSLSSSTKGSENEVLQEYKTWIGNQLKTYLDALEGIVLLEADDIQAAAIRTIVEVLLDGASVHMKRII
jgi:hypothetical protein